MKLVAEVHGDWRGSTRLYGSRARQAIAPLGDRLALWALRARGRLSRDLGLYGRARAQPRARARRRVRDLLRPRRVHRPRGAVPEQPVALFVGVLEPIKASTRSPPRGASSPRAFRARASTSSAPERRRTSPRRSSASGARWDRSLETEGIVQALDASRVLVLPSAAEGLGRVIMEAFLRARPVVASRVGGIPDLVDDGVNGLLVEPGSPDALADSLERVLVDRELASRLGEAAQAGAGRWLTTPEEFADNVRAVVDSVL